MRWLLLIGSILITGCENCPDRSVPLALSGTLARGVASTITVTFPDPVFVEPSPAREADIYIELVGPMDGTSQLRAVWRGDDDPPELQHPFERITVLDETRLEIEVLFETTARAGAYELAIIGDQAGACVGANGTVTLDLR